MLFIIVGDNKTFRKEKLDEILEPFTESERIVYTDTAGAVQDLEQFLYPSLFTISAPVVHAQFMFSEAVTTELAKKLIASPTVFIFEEFELPSPTGTALKKNGAIIYAAEKSKARKIENDIFAAVACITAVDKKSRWLAYRSALENHSIEAILGILYWKVRTLAANGGADSPYLRLYSKLLEAHARAWQSGAPLAALIERVILS